ncbi:MAG: hypothetical protein ACRD2N_21220 [Vicinamibacterales bacterium]
MNREWAGWLAFYLLVSIVFCSPLFAQPLAFGVNDWDQHLFYYGAVLKNVVEYGQMPFWNPWYCGGNVLWQNPQIALLSPVYPLSMVMPLQLAMKVNIVLHYWIGFVGAHLLIARGIGLTFTPVVVLLATLITAAGATAIHLTAGHSVFLPGLYLPLLLYYYVRALNTGALRNLFLAAALLALMVFNGGVHILPMAVAALGSLSVFIALLSRSLQPVVGSVVFMAAGFAYAAPKLLPVSLYVLGDTFWDTRNPTEHPDRVTLEMLRHVYLDPNQHTGLTFELQRHRWQEYGNYIGPLAALLIALGVVVALLRRTRDGDVWSRALALTTLLLFSFSLGEFSPLAPASLVTALPLFSSFRIPSRYTILFVVFATLTVGSVARSLIERRALGRFVARTVTVICVLAALHLIVTNRNFFVRVFRDAPSFDPTFRVMSGPAELVIDRDSNPYQPGSPMLRALMSDQSFFSCYESLQLGRTADSDRPLVYSEGNALISNVRFSPNRIEFDASAGLTASPLFLNQNFAHGWSSDVGLVARERDTGRLSITLGSGQTGHFSFEFVPPGLWMGTMIAIIAVAASIVMRNLKTSSLECGIPQGGQ